MSNIVIAGTGPLIALSLVRLLHEIPNVLGEVYVPGAVLQEALIDPAKKGASEIQHAISQGWIIRHDVKLTEVYQGLVAVLDPGEAEALALAEQLGGVALVDERRGRRVAKHYGIAVTGTAAVLIKAKRVGAISVVKPLLNDLIDHGYRFSQSLLRDVLSKCGE